MADKYVRSTDGSNSDNGSTWALAKASLAGSTSVAAAGDTIYVSQVHAETAAASASPTWNGTAASPNRILCGNDGAEPPTALATTATAGLTGASSWTLRGSFYMHGIAITCGDTSGSITLNDSGPNIQRYHNCDFIIGNAGGTSKIAVGAASTPSQSTHFKDCRVKFGAAAQGLTLNGALVRWNGGSVIAGGTTPTAFVNGAGVAGAVDFLIENFDFSSLGAFAFSVAPRAGSKVIARNCRMPSGWSVLSGAFSAALPGRIETYNCDDGNTNYRVWIEDYAGTIRDETTLVRTNGASDGTTPLAWKMTANASAQYPLWPLASPEFIVWNNATGVAKTVSVAILHDSATNLKDNEVWLEVQELGNASYALGSSVDDAAADVLATAADQATDGSSAWTTTGMANPNKQVVSVSFTPRNKGPFYCRVMLAKASKTIYIDPLATVT